MRASRLLALTTGLAVALGAAPAGAPAEDRARSACQRLKAEQRDLAPDRRLVLVRRGSFETGAIVACVLPRGRVRRLARWDDGLGRASAGVVRTKGTFVLLVRRWSDQYGGNEEVLRRVDVRRGRRLTLTGYGCQGPCSSGTTYGDVVLARTGAGAVEVTDLAAGTTTLQAFAPGGALLALDDGPVEDLRIERGELVWTRAGEERRAPLPA